jgi:hypothetical protein
MDRAARAVVATLLLLASPAAPAADPIAFVSDFRGDVAMNGAGRPPFLAELIPGTKLVLGAEATATVMYVVSGEEFLLKGPGDFTVTRQGVKALKGPPPAIRVPPLKASTTVLVQTSRTATASLRMRSATAPRGDRAGPLYPVNARIASAQPVLRWAGDPGATWTITVATAAGKEAFRGTAKGTSLRLPVRLAAGETFLWSVSAGSESGEARFETLPADAVAAADKARAAARSFADRVLLAMFLQDLGAAQDSREVWAQLAAERPDIPELAGLAR